MENLKRKHVSNYELEFDSYGCLVVREEGKPNMEKPFNSESDMKSEAGSHRSTNSKKTQALGVLTQGVSMLTRRLVSHRLCVRVGKSVRRCV